VGTSFKVARSVFRGTDEEDSFKSLLAAVGIPVVVVSFVKTPNALLVEVELSGDESKLFRILTDLGYPVDVIGVSQEVRGGAVTIKGLQSDSQRSSDAAPLEQQPSRPIDQSLASVDESRADVNRLPTRRRSVVLENKQPPELPTRPTVRPPTPVLSMQPSSSAVATSESSVVGVMPPPVKVRANNDLPAGEKKESKMPPPLINIKVRDSAPSGIGMSAGSPPPSPDISAVERIAPVSFTAPRRTVPPKPMPSAQPRVAESSLSRSTDNESDISKNSSSSVEDLSEVAEFQLNTEVSESGDESNGQKKVLLIAGALTAVLVTISSTFFYRDGVFEAYKQLSARFMPAKNLSVGADLSSSETSAFRRAVSQESNPEAQTKVLRQRSDISRASGRSEASTSSNSPAITTENNGPVTEEPEEPTPSTDSPVLLSAEGGDTDSPVTAEASPKSVSAELDRSRTMSFSAYRERHLREDFAIRRGTIREEEYETKLPITLSLCLNIDGSVSSVDVVKDGDNSSRVLRLVNKWANTTLWRWKDGSPTAMQCGITLTVM
jgi:hypothetical protein